MIKQMKQRTLAMAIALAPALVVLAEVAGRRLP